VTRLLGLPRIPLKERVRRGEELAKLIERGEWPEPDVLEQRYGGSGDIRSRGTAIFLGDEDGHYLATARHVVHDVAAAVHRYKEEKSKGVKMALSVLQECANKIYETIIRVPSYEEFKEGQSPEESMVLMKYDNGSYIFSKPHIDLAVISLHHHWYPGFAENLRRMGHTPIPLADIADGPSGEGAEVFTAGFPSCTAVIEEVDRDLERSLDTSDVYSLPVLSFGRVGMVHAKIPHFLADMSVYAGNSGGPVVEGDKLVGIASSQTWVPIERITPDGGSIRSDEYRVRMPFGFMIKTVHLKQLIAKQKERDEILKHLVPPG
jgi:Trypsin-like peptidase domain